MSIINSHIRAHILAVTFDAWETLLFERKGSNSQRMFARSKNVSKVLNKFGYEISIEQTLSILKAMAPWLMNIWETNSDVTHFDQIRFIAETATKESIMLKEEIINELSLAYVSPLFECPPSLNPDIKKLLHWLKEKEKLVGLICNTGRTPGFAIRRFLEKEGLKKYFDIMLFSDEVGIRKPDPRIFQVAIEKLNVKPYEIIHVGDNLKSDVWGAKNAGWKAIYFSTQNGRDEIAESDPTSLVTFSRKLGDLKEKEIVPDETITSLNLIIEVIKRFNNDF